MKKAISATRCMPSQSRNTRTPDRDRLGERVPRFDVLHLYSFLGTGGHTAIVMPWPARRVDITCAAIETCCPPPTLPCHSPAADGRAVRRRDLRRMPRGRGNFSGLVQSCLRLNSSGKPAKEALRWLFLLEVIPMSIFRLYSGSDGQSHLEKLSFSFTPGDIAEQSPTQAASGISFSRIKGGAFSDWHNAPRRQYVITLAGALEIGLGDGSVHRLGPGDGILAEDLTGKGHTTRAVGNDTRRGNSAGRLKGLGLKS